MIHETLLLLDRYDIMNHAQFPIVNLPLICVAQSICAEHCSVCVCVPAAEHFSVLNKSQLKLQGTKLYPVLLKIIICVQVADFLRDTETTSALTNPILGATVGDPASFRTAPSDEDRDRASQVCCSVQSDLRFGFSAEYACAHGWIVRTCAHAFMSVKSPRTRDAS